MAVAQSFEIVEAGYKLAKSFKKRRHNPSKSESANGCAGNWNKSAAGYENQEEF